MRKTSKPHRSTKSIIAVIMTFVVTSAALLVTASPAAAATTRCSDWQIQNGPVVTQVSMKTCVVKNGNSRYAYVLVEQWRTYSGKDWDRFKVHARLERNDANKATKWCDFTDEMNRYLVITLYCTTSTVTSSTSGGWTGDAVIVFNFNLDGLGDKSKALTGSPAVS
ncbi:hypothetical protein K1W54_15575 [Micromonospora sp. CPCC 205371]|nr:hypothetical protein [Micromonospora sp. CPCC 205371]